MPAYLFLDFEAPMTSFGGDVVDSRGVVRDFPARSMLAGLIGNALGFERSNAEALDSLQSRIVHATALVRTGQRRREYQTARLFENESGWTTHGQPEGRAKSPSFSWDARYEIERGERRKSLTHQRYRDHQADARTFIVITLDPEYQEPNIKQVAHALRFPSRPLFIGRKACIPSRLLLQGIVEAPDDRAALAQVMSNAGVNSARVQWHANANELFAEPATATTTPPVPYSLMGEQELTICDERQHTSGVHGGTRKVLQGILSLAQEQTLGDALELHSLSSLMGDSR